MCHTDGYSFSQRTRQRKNDIWENKCALFKPSENCHILPSPHQYLHKSSFSHSCDLLSSIFSP